MDYIVPSRFDPEVSSHSIHTLEPGLTASDVRRVLHTDISKYVSLARDRNPIHSNPDYAQGTRFGQEIALGLLPEGILSSLLGTKLPGQGAIYVSKTVSFLAPVNAGDHLTTIIQVEEVDRAKRMIKLTGECHNLKQVRVSEYQTLLMLDRGQELEFVCDFFKFAADRDPIDAAVTQELRKFEGLKFKEKMSAYASFYEWESADGLADVLAGTIKKHEQKDKIQGLIFGQSGGAQNYETIDPHIWWCVVPRIFVTLTSELAQDEKEAVKNILKWTASATGMDSKVNLSGLAKLNNVTLSRHGSCFNPVSHNEVTRDMRQALADHVARYVIPRLTKDK